MAIYVPIVMYGLRLFIVILQELQIVYDLSYYITKLRYSIPYDF